MTNTKSLGADGQARKGSAARKVNQASKQKLLRQLVNRLRRVAAHRTEIYLASVQRERERERQLADPGWQAREYLEKLMRSAAFDQRVLASPERAELQSFVLTVAEAIRGAPRGAAAHEFSTLLHRWWGSEVATRAARDRSRARIREAKGRYASDQMKEREEKVSRAWDALLPVHRGHGALVRLQKETGYSRETVMRCVKNLNLPIKKRVGST